MKVLGWPHGRRLIGVRGGAATQNGAAFHACDGRPTRSCKEQALRGARRVARNPSLSAANLLLAAALIAGTLGNGVSKADLAP